MVAEDDVLSTSLQPAAEQISPPASETVSMLAAAPVGESWEAYKNTPTDSQQTVGAWLT
jgi:hypothetical protein